MIARLRQWWRSRRTPHGASRNAPRGALRLAPTLRAVARREDCALTACDAGWCATVLGVDCPAVEAHRLRTLGVYEGARVSVVDRRSGVLLDVCGTRLALNTATAANIFVRPVAA